MPLALIFLTTAGCNSCTNVCPIDGQPPEGRWRRNGQACEYFHYSVIEKKTLPISVESYSIMCFGIRLPNVIDSGEIAIKALRKRLSNLPRRSTDPQIY